MELFCCDLFCFCPTSAYFEPEGLGCGGLRLPDFGLRVLHKHQTNMKLPKWHCKAEARLKLVYIDFRVSLGEGRGHGFFGVRVWSFRIQV